MNAEGTYNGWTNYETWSVYTVLTNECTSAYYWEREALEHWEGAEASKYHTRYESARATLAGAIVNELREGVLERVVEQYGDSTVGHIVSSLLGSAIDNVNAMELADAFLGAVDITADTPDPDDEEEEEEECTESLQSDGCRNNPTLRLLYPHKNQNARLYWPTSGTVIEGRIVNHGKGQEMEFLCDELRKSWDIIGAPDGWKGQEIEVEAQPMEYPYRNEAE